MLSHAAVKSEASTQRIDAAIRTLVRQNAPINFNSVSNLAHVSKTTLYGNPDYRSRIEKLLQSTTATATGATKRTITDKGKDIILAAKNKRIREWETEVQRLSTLLKRYYGNEYNKY